MPQKAHLTKALMIIFVVAICFVFAYIKDANAATGALRGIVNGNKWEMKSAKFSKKMVDDTPVLAIEFSDRELSDSEVCANEDITAQRLLVEVPLTGRNGSPNYEAAKVAAKGLSENEIPCFHDMYIEAKELNSVGSAYISGNLEMVSKKSKTEIAGDFKARVCN